MKLRILIVEDWTETLDDIVNIIEDIDEEKKIRYGIEEFSIETARWYSSAKKLLDEALKKRAPYDILILDLAIPKDEPTKERSLSEEADFGLNLLEFAKKCGAAKEIIVYSQFDEYENVAFAYQHGALDFISKSEDDEVLSRAVLSAWERVLNNETGAVFEKRLKLLAPYSERGLIHQFSECFSRLIQSVSHETEDMEGNFNDRLGLDSQSDTHDPLIQNTLRIKQAIRESKREWIELQAKMGIEEAHLSEIILMPKLLEIIEKLHPCLILKHVKITVRGNLEEPLLSVAQDVETILEEIILGGLSEVSNHKISVPEDLPQNIDISLSVNGQKTEVRFKDTFNSIAPEIASQINKGYRVGFHNRFDRVWGLSVAQQLASSRGGKLEIIPLPLGNTIVYQIPLTRYE